MLPSNNSIKQMAFFDYVRLRVHDIHVCPCCQLTPSLYEQDTVITEWEDFLEGIVSVPRPAATELGHGRHKGLAVDVSDFPAKLPWCRCVPWL